ncbi:putative bifunctional diguanylate cyclase/phosphodiesterase [Gorillibacterium sp. sgz500922]|uniref:putative bifunctional diguanylate cyclase/phosphodiesterase n=1 Tax=Gorillibacterium sp. sgz500922 TaxID=3446694 RepID=UPI003F66C80B
MGFKSGKTFSISHFLIPLLLVGLSALSSVAPGLLLVTVTFISLGWAFVLVWLSFKHPRTHAFIRWNDYALFLFVDFAVLTLIFLLPDWDALTSPIWMILPYILLYASELGSRYALYMSGCSLAALLIANGSQKDLFPHRELLIAALLGAAMVYFVGRRTDSLQKLAYRDPLTGLYNRSMFVDQLAVSAEAVNGKGMQLGLLFLDLDQFKYVNDTMGHSLGDSLLTMVAGRIKQVLPDDALFARMGGDEFTILLPEIKHTDRAAEIAEAILHVMRQSFPLNHQEIFVTMSIGISVYPEDGADPEALMKNADTAMYRAKEQGRNNYQFYSPVIDSHGHRRLKMETMLRHALEREEFLLLYQPRLDPRTGELVCVEALVRWIHPEFGLLPPSEFIPLAEDTGLIVPLGEQVLRLACKQRSRWVAQGFPEFNVSVNLSARQFRQTDLPETIAKVLKEFGLGPEWLELEITETAAMQDVHFAALMMRVLKEMDLRIAIDDFGTGYSSLNYLKRFPIDVIKIDRSFIKGIEQEPDDAAIVHAIIAMAQTMKLQVTAEGVETPEQYEYLKMLGCDEIQGFYVGQPMNAQQLGEWLSRMSELGIA